MNSVDISRFHFSENLKIIGVNPYLSLNEEILEGIFRDANKSKGPIPVCGVLNGKLFTQTLVKFAGEWRFYINLMMLENSPQRIGELLEGTIQFDPPPRIIEVPLAWTQALEENPLAKEKFDTLSPSRQKEIVRYLANLKSEESLTKNIGRAINHLLGKERFVGRD